LVSKRYTAPEVGEAPRVLIVLYGAIGDVVMATFAVSGLRASFPSAEIGWTIDSRCAAVLEQPHLINNVYQSQRNQLRSQGKPLAATIAHYRNALATRAMKAQVAFALQGHAKNLIAARISGAREVFVMPSRDRLVRTMAKTLPEFPPDTPQRERYFVCLRQNFEIADVGRPIMPAVENPLGEEQPDVVISVATNSPVRDYPLEKWTEVAAALSADGHRVAFIGGPGTKSPDFPDGLDLIGRHSLRETMGVIAGAKLHLGGDTGTGHIAAAYGVPTVVIYGPTNELQYAPAGSSTLALREGQDPAAVSPERVIEAARQLLPSVVRV